MVCRVSGSDYNVVTPTEIVLNEVELLCDNIILKVMMFFYIIHCFLAFGLCIAHKITSLFKSEM